MSKKFPHLGSSLSKGSRKSKSSSSGLQIHFSPGSDSDEGSAELVTSIKTLIKSKASSLDSAYHEIADLLRSDSTTLPHKKSTKKDKQVKSDVRASKSDDQCKVDRHTDESGDQTTASDPLNVAQASAALSEPVRCTPEPLLDCGDVAVHSTTAFVNEDTVDSTSIPSRVGNTASSLLSHLTELLSDHNISEPQSTDQASSDDVKEHNTEQEVARELNRQQDITEKSEDLQYQNLMIIGQGEGEKPEWFECGDEPVEVSDEKHQVLNTREGEAHLDYDPQEEHDNGNSGSVKMQTESTGSVTNPVQIHHRNSSTGSVGIVRSWDDGSVDPLTALNLESEDEDYYDHAASLSQHPRDPLLMDIHNSDSSSSLTLGKSEPLKPVVTKSDSFPTFSNVSDPAVLRHKSDSFDMVDDFYDVEPVEEFGGAVNTHNISQSLPSSPTHVTHHGNAGLKQALKRKLKKSAPAKVNIKPLQFSSLVKNQVSHDQKEGSPDSVDKESLDGLEMDKGVLNKNQSSNRSLIDYIPEYPAPLPWYHIISFTMCIFAYMILPIPSFMSGLILGAVVTFLCLRFYMWLIEPGPVVSRIMLQNIDVLPPLEVPETHQTNFETKDNNIIYEGWMNELTREYDFITYHVSETYSVFLKLEGTMLRLRRPKTNVPRHHVWYEQTQTSPFVHQRHYDLRGCHIFLRPEGLVKKRVWSKKYPICIILKKMHSSLKVPEAHPTNGGMSTSNGGSQKTSVEFKDQDRPKVSEEKKRDRSPFRKSFQKDKDKASKDSDFVMVPKDGCVETLFLFARTCREKEEWFYRLKAASKGQPLIKTLKSVIEDVQNSSLACPSLISAPTVPAETDRRLSSQTSHTSMSPSASSETLLKSGKEMSCLLTTPQELLEEYVTYMGRLMPAKPKRMFGSSPLAPHHSISCDSQLMWLNALIGRLFFDFLRIGHWKNKVREKIQKKLNKIHVPYFIDQLTMTDIDLGGELPTIRRATKPFLDDRGLWIDLDIAYGGGFRMTLETKVNLMKLKKTSRKTSERLQHPNLTTSSVMIMDTKRLAVTNSDEEDSAESSSDEDAADIPEPENITSTSTANKPARGAGKKILRIIDTITDTKFFQNATENKYVKRAMENVSNTKLVLNVEVVNLSGVLALNLAPPPTDRLWYGFRTNPTLTLSAKPRVGERAVSMTKVTEWIEKKLSVEFQKVWVIPNMDDIVIPFMRASQHEEKSGSK